MNKSNNKMRLQAQLKWAEKYKRARKRRREKGKRNCQEMPKVPFVFTLNDS